MMLVRILALIVTLVGATGAWGLLETTLIVRTAQESGDQRVQLGSSWGPEQTQTAPDVFYSSGKTHSSIPIEASAINVDLALDQRRKGLLWYNTYRVDFHAAYRIVNSSHQNLLRFALALPAEKGVYDDVRILVNDRPTSYVIDHGVVTADIWVQPGHAAEVTASYGSRGLERWFYQFGSGINRVRNFGLVMRTNFDAIDFPPNALAPTQERTTSNGWELAWRYKSLVAGDGIGMVFPERLQPGPLAQRITFWAPLSLLFYFFVLFIITVIRRIDLHPMNYFFLAASFFAFHLLFAYSVDRVPVWLAFFICSLVLMFLTVRYLRIVAGLRFAAVEAGLAQFFYLILFSLALFNEGFSGLAITIGSIITLFIVMQLTARINWSERFASLPGRAQRTSAQ